MFISVSERKTVLMHESKTKLFPALGKSWRGSDITVLGSSEQRGSLAQGKKENHLDGVSFSLVVVVCPFRNVHSERSCCS